MSRHMLICSLLFAALASIHSMDGSFASSPSAAKAKDKSRVSDRLGAKLGTDHRFDEMSVRGRYQSAFEGAATVENEKGLDDLLDYRTNYSDRLKTSKSQR